MKEHVAELEKAGLVFRNPSSACERQVEYDLVDAEDVDGPFVAVLEKLESGRQVEDSPEETQLYPWEETVCFPSAAKDDRT